MAIDHAPARGSRGLPGDSSLAQLLAEHRGVRNKARPPRLTWRQILGWADAHHARTGTWPTCESGEIREAPGETWKRIQTALVEGLRGLPGGSSLPRLLLAKRGVRKRMGRLRGPRHREAQIVAWARAHRSRTGRWPSKHSGPVLDAPGETWAGISIALLRSRRGLPGGSSLARLLQPYRAQSSPANSLD
jgi:hypothetical protein